MTATSKSLLLIHHAASGQPRRPPNSLWALQACLEAGARAVEVDISPLADGEFVLLHGQDLEEETTGVGPIGARRASEMRGLRHVWQGEVTEAPVGLLDEALALLARHPQPVELQLDLKPYIPLTEATLARLVATLQPLRERVRVTSVGDWVLRRLRALDPELPLGFDPLLYLAVDSEEEREPREPPFRRGAYGYWDEHPLASWRWGETADYLAARAEALWAQAPSGALWYIAARLLARALDDGFDWIADLHRRGAQVAAWTLDASQPEQAALARRLAALGVDRITTNEPSALARQLEGPVVY